MVLGSWFIITVKGIDSTVSVWLRKTRELLVRERNIVKVIGIDDGPKGIGNFKTNLERTVNLKETLQWTVPSRRV